MVVVTIKNIPDDTHHALEARATRNGRSLEAEVIDILRQATAVQPSAGVGSQLRQIGHAFGGVDLDDIRDRSPYTPLTLRSSQEG